MHIVDVDLFPDTPFPYEWLKGCIGNVQSPQERQLDLRICNAEASSVGPKDAGRIWVYSDRTQLYIRYESHQNGGRERFRSDMNRLHDLLIETGGYKLVACYVFYSSCCEELIPATIGMFSAKSSECSDMKLVLSEKYGVRDPMVAANIVENWRISSKGRGATIRFYPKDISRHRPVLEAMFSKPNVEMVDINMKDSNHSMGAAALRLLSSIASSCPASTVRSLVLYNVSACKNSDRELASMIETNKSLTHLRVTFDEDNWSAMEMSRAMRDVNCTLGSVVLRPVMHAHSFQTEIEFYAALNKHGRKFMRSMTFEPQKIPALLESAGRGEGSRLGWFLYPLLRENPSMWTSYIAHRHIEDHELELFTNNPI